MSVDELPPLAPPVEDDGLTAPLSGVAAGGGAAAGAGGVAVVSVVVADVLAVAPVLADAMAMDARSLGEARR